LNQKRYIKPIWKLIWKWNGLEHIKIFIWTVAHNSLLTYENWVRRNLTEDPNCQLKMDNVIYVLRDCYFAHMVWKILVKCNDRLKFFNVDLNKWLINNLSSSEYSKEEVLWAILSGNAIWYLWKWRNLRIFNKEAIFHSNPLNAIKCFVANIKDTNETIVGHSNKSKQVCMVG
jgi:hypothetical protein